MKTYLLDSAKTVAVLGAFTATAMMSTQAHAISPQTEEVSVTIDSRDLVTKRGVERVYKRLAKKAKSACDTPGRRGISDTAAEKECARRLLSEFIENVDSAKLTSYYAAHKASV